MKKNKTKWNNNGAVNVAGVRYCVQMPTKTATEKLNNFHVFGESRDI